MKKEKETTPTTARAKMKKLEKTTMKTTSMGKRISS